MQAVIPAKLEADDEVRVVSPAVSLGFILQEQRKNAEERWGKLGLGISYSPNGEVLDRFDSSPVEARVSDLHGAFADPCGPPTSTSGCERDARRSASPAFSASCHASTASTSGVLTRGRSRGGGLRVGLAGFLCSGGATLALDDEGRREGAQQGEARRDEHRHPEAGDEGPGDGRVHGRGGAP